MKHRTLILALFAAIAVAGCGHEVADKAAAKTPPPKLIRIGGQSGVLLDSESVTLAGITVASAQSGTLEATTQPTGEIESTDAGSVQITSRLPGKLTGISINLGDRVHKGETIAEIDSVDLATAEAAYQTAVSHAQLAKHQLEQQRKLAGFGVLSEQPVEDARKAAVAADAAVGSDEAQIKVDQLALTSARQLVAMGETTRKPVEDAQNAYASAVSAAGQAAATLHSTKSSYDRAVILFNGGIFSRQQLEDAQTAYNSAQAASGQAKIAESLASQELKRQQTIYKQNLNGAASLQGALSKLQQDRHTYQNDLVADSLAKTQLQRARVVHKSGIPVSQALQAAEDASAEANIAVQGAADTLKIYGVQPGEAQSGLERGRVLVPIVSPIDGIVASRTMVAGQNVDTSTTLARLVNLDVVDLDAQVYEKDIEGVAVGDPVRFHVPAFPGKRFVGTVQFVAHEVNPDTRTVLVRTAVMNPGWQLRPGMFAGIVIGAAKGDKTLSIPADAVLQEGDDQIVYVRVAPGEFVRRKVRVGVAEGGRVPVSEGLTAGDEVVVAGNVLIQKAQDQLESGTSASQ